MSGVTPYKQLAIPRASDISRGKRILFFRSPYLIWSIVSYLLIILMISLYLSKEAVFSSSMSLVLPGSGSSSSVKLEEVGTAKSQTKSPFSQSSFNPRVNYKEIIKSREVIDSAANNLSMTPNLFSTPKVKLTQQSSILQIEIRANTSELATKKAWSLYNAFQEQLDKLREDEALRRDQSIERVLEKYRQRLSQTRSAIVTFQQRSLIISEEQLLQSMSQTSQLNADVMHAVANRVSKQQEVNQLSYDLGISPDMAGKAFSLQTDTQFMGHIKELDESAKQTSEFLSMWGQNHPKVKSSQKRLAKAEKATLKRAKGLLGNNASALYSINLSASPDRSALFRQLIDNYSQLKGMDARVEKLASMHSLEKDRLKILAREAKELERLNREHDLAEAVFTSAAADLEAGKSNVFASYPVVQILASPSIPQKQVSPTLTIAAIAGVLGFAFVTSVVLIIWQREYLLSKLLNK